MMEDSAQTAKVEQTDLDDMGQVIRFPNADERHLVKPGLTIAAPQKKGTSPNKGYVATGRTREHLERHEVEMLLERAKKTGRNSHRNYCIILMMFRHGLRVGEAADLQWSDINFVDGTMHVRRLKGSNDSTHPIRGDEIRALRRLQRESPQTPYLFVDGQGKPLAESAIAAMIKRLGSNLFSFPIHSHMLRHSCGHYLAMRGTDTRTIQDYLGHREIQNTVRYTKLSPTKFKGLWD